MDLLGSLRRALIKADDASLIGLHSSWDKRTLMRHGVSLQAVRGFLSQTLSSVDTIDADTKKSLALLCVPKDPNLQKRSTPPQTAWKTTTMTGNSQIITIDEYD